jgi:pimeloyl-ACP methyl ester carboxylesterase
MKLFFPFFIQNLLWLSCVVHLSSLKPCQMPYSEHLRTVNGIRLHTVEMGPAGAPVILFLHGFPEFWYGWHRQIDYFAALGYRVIVPDQRGYNQSDKPPGVRAYATDWLVKDVVALIQATDREKVTLVGHDWGAIVAWLVAEAYPHLLHRLVILNVPHPSVMRHTLRSQPRQMLKSWYAGFFQIPWLPERLMRLFGFAPMIRSLQSSSRPDTFSEQDLVRYREAWNRPGALTSMLNWYRAFSFFKEGSLSGKKIAVRTLILWGVQDAALIWEMAALSADRCEQATLHYFEDATHWVQHEKSAEVNRLISEFIAAPPAEL